MADGSEAKRDLERTKERLDKPTKNILKFSWRRTKEIAKFIANKFRYFFFSPFKAVQYDGRTKEVVKLNVDGGLTFEETKQFLLKADKDNIKVLVKEYTRKDRVHEKTLYAQERLYKKDKRYQRLDNINKSIVGKIPVVKSILKMHLKNTKTKILLQEETEKDTKFMVFVNKSNREWLSETLAEVRNSIITKRDVNNEEIEQDLDFTQDVVLKANEIEIGKEYGIGVEQYTNNYCEVQLPREAYIKLDEVFLQNDVKYGAKIFEGDDVVTVRFSTSDYNHYRAVFPASSYTTKEIGDEGGKTLKQDSDIPILTQSFKTEKDYFAHRAKNLNEEDYIATFNKDGSVDLRISANVIVEANREYEKKQQTLMDLALDAYHKGGHEGSLERDKPLEKSIHINNHEINNDDKSNNDIKDEKEKLVSTDMSKLKEAHEEIHSMKMNNMFLEKEEEDNIYDNKEYYAFNDNKKPLTKDVIDAEIISITDENDEIIDAGDISSNADVIDIDDIELSVEGD